ncbi:hypothetical protein DFP72DRAFT_1048890 [Ephemerocybe angulata]|uniref:Uncharacterized protein n=1 Tax=Ephemerocybe angulata TaxID=980116 RepID=A0A8H6HM87_9AGAR|nr:hypothetical protein DFP72DRAFT_1048890 [Tulosesus angulatus]
MTTSQVTTQTLRSRVFSAILSHCSLQELEIFADVPMVASLARMDLKKRLSSVSLRELESLADFPMAGPIARTELKQRVGSLLNEKELNADDTLRHMREWNVVMEGPAALQVLMPECNGDRSLSFCCPRWGSMPFCQFLSSAGYSLKKRDDQTVEVPDDGRYNIHTGCIEVITMGNGDGCTVTVCESVSMCPLVPIFFADSTASMNYVCADGVACLYPDMTLNKTGFINYSRVFLDEDRQAGMAKYRANGFNILDTCEDAHTHHDEGLQVTCQRRTRGINDRQVLMLPFTTSGFVPIRPFVRWRLGYNRRLDDGSLHEKDVMVSVEAEGGSFIEYNSNQPRFDLDDLLYRRLEPHFDEW